MTQEIDELLKYLKSVKSKSFKKLARLAHGHGQGIEEDDYITIKSEELKRILNPDDYKFTNGNLPRIPAPANINKKM
jgi:hypothetical protein